MKSESIMSISTDQMSGIQLIQNVNPAQIPSIVSEKSKALEALSEQVEKAKTGGTGNRSRTRHLYGYERASP